MVRRIRIGEATDEREHSSSKVPALEASVPASVDNKTGNAINSAIGTSFGSVEEGTNFTISTRGKLVLVSDMQKAVLMYTKRSLCGMIQSVFVIYVVCVTLD